jgi:hypothetical protein
VIRETPITVELIPRKLDEGETENELLEDYPHLTPDDIRWASAYGARRMSKWCLWPPTPANTELRSSWRTRIARCW